MSTIVTVCQRQIYAFIEAHIHSSVDQCLDCLGIIINRIFYILNLAAVAQIPETVLQILFLNGGNILCHMTVEAVADIFSIGYALNNTVLFTELLYLQTTQILCRSSVDSVQVAVLFLVFRNLLIDMLQYFHSEGSILYQGLAIVKFLQFIQCCNTKACRCRFQ